jgi:hypothetical protein
MIHLKPFMEAQTEDKPYYEIDQDEYVSLINDEDQVYWTKKEEWTMIESIINANSNLYYKNLDSKIMSIVFDRGHKIGQRKGFIIKNSDHWFVISLDYHSKFFKCDELDGLLKFIKEKKDLWN